MKKINFNSRLLITCSGIFLTSPVWAGDGTDAGKNWFMTDGTFWILIAVSAILFYVIYALSEVMIWGGGKKLKDHKNKSTLMALLISMGLLFISGNVNAQSTETASGSEFSFFNSDYLPLYILIVIEIVVIMYMAIMLRQVTRKEKIVAEGRQQSYISRLWEKWNYKVPIEREGEVLLDDHEYDGIQELDNSMPPWLQYIFYFTIVFAIIYFWYYNFGGGPTQIDEYNKEMAQAEIEKAAYLEKAAANYDENSVTLSSDPSVAAAGKNTFTQYCVTCHGNNAEGGVGPNLTDDYWIHGGKINDLFKTVKYGVQGKAMAAWKDVLTAKQIYEVTNYVKSLHGTNPPNAKAPDGELYVEGATGDSTAMPIDSMPIQDSLKLSMQ